MNGAHFPGPCTVHASAVCAEFSWHSCGCGVGFKLIQALSLKWDLSIEELCPYLDFVALAIGADMVPLDGENRILAYWGMLQIQKGERIAFRTLLGDQKELDELSLTD